MRHKQVCISVCILAGIAALYSCALGSSLPMMPSFGGMVFTDSTVVISYNRVFESKPPAYVLSLDKRTGKLRWKTEALRTVDWGMKGIDSRICMGMWNGVWDYGVYVLDVSNGRVTSQLAPRYRLYDVSSARILVTDTSTGLDPLTVCGFDLSDQRLVWTQKFPNRKLVSARCKEGSFEIVVSTFRAFSVAPEEEWAVFDRIILRASDGAIISRKTLKPPTVTAREAIPAAIRNRLTKLGMPPEGFGDRTYHMGNLWLASTRKANAEWGKGDAIVRLNESTGKTIWKRPIPYIVDCTPYNQALYVHTNYGYVARLIALDAGTGRVLWSRQFPQLHDWQFNRGKLYAAVQEWNTHGNKFYFLALNPRTGKNIWKAYLPD